MKKLTLILALITFYSRLICQVGINTTGNSPHSSAGLDVDFTNKGVLIPRMTQAQRNAIASPATSLLIYQTDNTPGFYYYDGSTWRLLGGYIAGTGINITGNVISNSAPDQTITISSGSGISVTGSYPNFTITNTGVTASCGSANYIPKTISSTSLGCSQIYDNGTNVGIATIAPSYKLDVNGAIRSNNEIISTLGSGYGQFRAISGNYGAFIRNDGNDTYIPLLTNTSDPYGTWNSLRPLRINNASGDVFLANSNIIAQHSSGYLGIGTTSPSQRLHVVGNVLFTGSLMPNGNAGTNGQILVSQGPGNPPVWQTPATIPIYGNNMTSVKLTTYATNSDVTNWTTLLTLNITPVHNTIYIFSSLGTRLEDNSGNAQFGQALVNARILVNGVEVARNASVITDYDEDYYGNSYIVTSGSVSFSGIPVSVTAGNPTTVVLQWKPTVLWANTPWRLGINPNGTSIGDHAVLTVFD